MEHAPVPCIRKILDELECEVTVSDAEYEPERNPVERIAGSARRPFPVIGIRRYIYPAACQNACQYPGLQEDGNVGVAFEKVMRTGISTM